MMKRERIISRVSMSLKTIPFLFFNIEKYMFLPVVLVFLPLHAAAFIFQLDIHLDRRLDGNIFVTCCTRQFYPW
jgi:hypothetical protein